LVVRRLSVVPLRARARGPGATDAPKRRRSRGNGGCGAKHGGFLWGSCDDGPKLPPARADVNRKPSRRAAPPGEGPRRKGDGPFLAGPGWRSPPIVADRPAPRPRVTCAGLIGLTHQWTKCRTAA